MADAPALFPKEVMDILNTSFMGFKLWHLLLVSLVIPSPLAFMILFFIIPGFKEKVTELIRNGFNPSTASGTGEGGQVSSASESQNPTATRGSNWGEGQGSFGEQLIQKATAGFRSAEGISETF